MKTRVVTVICYIMQASDWSGLVINTHRYQDNHDDRDPGRDILVANLQISANMSYADTTGLYQLNKPCSFLGTS
jgi:hypothetical protein